MANSSAPGAPLTPELQAAALWTYVQAKVPRFSSKAALAVVQDVAAKPDENLKPLAKRLRSAMAKHGVAIKQAAALEAAARLAGHPSWHEAPRDTPVSPLLLIPIAGSGNQTDMFTAPQEQLARWRDAVPRMAHWCDARRRNTASKVFEVHLTADSLMVGTPASRYLDGRSDQLYSEPVFGIRPVAKAADWLKHAPAAVEMLRRHLEETGAAVLDGVAVLDLCDKYAQRVGHAPSSSDVNVTADVPNTELVLLREDNELMPGSGFEIARGDEMTCWHQFELAVKDHDEGADVTLDGESWRIGAGRYVWDLVTLRPNEYVPGLSTRRLDNEDVAKLLRRYKLAKNILAGQVRHHEVNKRVEYLAGPQETYRVDLHGLLLAAKNGGHTWESLCEAVSDHQEMTDRLPLGFILAAAKFLNVGEPNQFFARPNLSEMAQVNDDQVLRALLPRVDTVRYRVGSIPGEARAPLKEAVTELSDSLRVRTMSRAGVFVDAKQELPQLVYGQDGEDLRLKVQELGLVLYAGVLPHLFPMDALGEKAPQVEMAPYAFGHCLYLHVDVPK